MSTMTKKEVLTEETKCDYAARHVMNIIMSSATWKGVFFFKYKFINEKEEET